MPKFSAYMRGEGSVGPIGETGPIGPTGNLYYATFDIDVEDGILYMYNDISYDGPEFEINEATGELEVII